MKTIEQYAQMLRRRDIKCKKGQPMLGFTEPKSHRCNWTIMHSTYEKLREESQKLGISPSSLIDLILMKRYQFPHLFDDGEKEKS